jgi:hypothetical protein
MQMMLENSNVEEDDDDGEESDEDAVADGGRLQLEENNGDSITCSPAVAEEDDDDMSIKNVFDGTTPVASRVRAANDEHRRRGVGHGKNGPISASSPALNCRVAGDYLTERTTKHLIIILDLLADNVKAPNCGLHVN